MNRIITLVALFSCASTPTFADEFMQFFLAQSGGIEQQNPSTSFATLNYQVCTNQEKDALLKMNVIGSGLVPAGSTITLATLRLRAQVGGDGQLYRCAESWDSSPTWNELGGNVSTIGSSIGVGLNTGQSIEFDVTSHVQLWADGTSNQGWVIKGSVNDCAQARVYNGFAGPNDVPRLTVIFVPPVPPDTTPPQVVDIDIVRPMETQTAMATSTTTII
jgi:hypothetical protein